MVDALLDERATLDKFIGDSVMAYFGAPLPDPGHVRARVPCGPGHAGAHGGA